MVIPNTEVLHIDITLPPPGGKPLYNSPAVNNGRLYLCSVTQLDVYDLTRSLPDNTLRPYLIGSTPLLTQGEYILTPALPLQDFTLFGTTEGLIAVRDITSGFSRLLAGRCSAIASRKGIVAVVVGDRLYGYTPDGERRWECHLPMLMPPEQGVNEEEWLIFGDDDHLLFADRIGQVWIVYPSTGHTTCVARTLGTIKGLALLPNGGICIATATKLMAVDMAGHPLWPPVDESIDTLPIVTRHLILAGTATGQVVDVDHQSGTWTSLGIGSGATRGVAISGSSVVGVTSEGALAAHDLAMEGE